MARTIRFHFDEQCAKAIASELRSQGVDVTTTPQAGLIGATDEVQAAHSLAEGRVVFTQDRDFLRIAATGPQHAGIVYCPKDTKSIGEIVHGLILIWEVLAPEEMANRIEYL